MSNDTKPTLAAGMARRSFWIAAAGGTFGYACRLEALGQATQAFLSLLAVALLLIAMVFGAVALIRIRADDRNAVLMPALGGALLGLVLLANLTNWSRDKWVRARMRTAQAEETSTPAPQRTEGTERTERSAPKSAIKYDLPALDDLAATVNELRAQAARARGDDAAVFRAWAVHLEKIHTAYAGTFAASNKLHEIDLLDPKLVANFNQDEPVRRRGLANKYSDAWRALGERLSTLEGAYYTTLRGLQVPTERADTEGHALSAAIRESEMFARLASLQTRCKAEEDVGRHYNYAVSAVYDYAFIASKVPNPSPTTRAQMDRQVAKLKEVEQAAAEARR